VGLTVTGVMLALFHAFAGFAEAHYRPGADPDADASDGEGA